MPPKAKVHVIKASRLYTLLVVGVVIGVWNWALLTPSTEDRPLKLPRILLGAQSYKLRIVEYDAVTIMYTLPKIETTDWTTSNCPDECGAAKGRGICDGLSCVCYEGHGAQDCSISLELLYSDHPVYYNLTLRPLDVSGWDMGGDLYKYLVQSVKPYLVVEIGVWKGSSALKLASALKAQGNGVLVAVDTWLPVLEFWRDQSNLNRMTDLQFHNGYPSVFYTFLSNVVQFNLTDFVVPMPATSRTAADFMMEHGQLAELIHIDAGHRYKDTEEDIRLWWPLLRPGGILLGDEWSLIWPGVLQAVREHAIRYHLDIHVFRNKWWVYKPRK